VSIEIVQIREEHIEDFHNTLGVVSRERKYLALLDAPPIESTAEFVRKTIARGHPQLVALAEGRVVGWCDVTPSDRPTARHCGRLGMGLLPKWRGKGLGERLLRQALEASVALGLSRVELSVRAGNTRAQRLYRKVGFAVEGRSRRAVLVDGVFYDLIFMALLFGGDAVPLSGIGT
jgi:RimJ/RimL family protein N-acetyltransferase